ncbi:predicted protein [Plenodomus lingam JN3]|uniref:Predicted protein n=1 Tax=Leptosphaeria maculans (strain JN3 / isolate v23.1.3 / race Av1-4-5-6-7-8) TaxID=985895 RepID=E4ZHG9_LEPMJ|nr:predicted protein [Plenodomus lingam JN3]CBX90802.1 predicted protein [Plenodomus lingam JN3]
MLIMARRKMQRVREIKLEGSSVLSPAFAANGAWS